MALFKWKDAYSVGIREIDEQHQALFALANQLHEARLAGKGREVVVDVLRGLFTYTQTHFITEERLMQAANYPALSAHKKVHDQFALEVSALFEDIRKNGTLSTLEVANKIKDWLIKHIQDMDQQYAPYLRAQEDTTQSE
jgi:hemerythrin